MTRRIYVWLDYSADVVKGDQRMPVFCTSYAVNHSRSFFACGSKVFPILSYAVFALDKRKNRIRKDVVYRSAEGENSL